ncbi:MAG: hypothetical protein U0Q55_22030 [Vicinamibacterales bacterium]
MSDLVAGDGTDPIDSRLAGTGVPRGRWVWHRHALGLAASPVPSFVALLAGVALGPDGLGVLTPRVLQAVEPVVAAMTVAMGMLIGLEVDLRRPGAPRLLAGASVQSGITFVVVGAAVSLAARMAGWEWAAAWYVPLLLGVAAASSATRPRGDDDVSLAARLGDLDDLLPMVIGAVILASAAGRSVAGGLFVLGLTTALAVAIAVAGSLLVSGSSSEGESRVYAAASVLLASGLAASLSASTLFVGAVVAYTWNQTSERARDSLAQDVRYLQHPIVVLVLVLAGAEASTSTPVLVLALLVALVRVACKLAGGRLASTLFVPGLDRWFGLRLAAPGAAGLAAVLMVVHVTHIATVSEPILGIAVWGAILSDILALLLTPAEARL